MDTSKPTNHPHYSLLVYLIVILFFVGCQPAVVYTNEGRPRSRGSQTTRIDDSTLSDKVTGVETGRVEYMVTSWYGNQYHGRQTASGEIFNMYDYTAAHRTLPFGTKLKLINESNNKEINVRINDRGPVPLERDLDVSYRVAEELGFIDAGLSRLKVIFLK